MIPKPFDKSLGWMTRAGACPYATTMERLFFVDRAGHHAATYGRVSFAKTVSSFTGETIQIKL
jgi:hypothetical protein